MREIIQKVHETSEFRCSAETVFSVLCTKDSYEEWYGWPKRVQLSSVEPGFSVGGRLRFRSFSNTKVITSFEPGRKLTLDDQLVEESFTIEPSVTGCTVTYSIALHDEASPIADKLRGVALGTLRALKDYTYSVEPVEGTAPRERQEQRESFFIRLLHGYASPVGRSARPVGDTITETSAALSGPRLALGGVLLVFMLALLNLLCGFPGSDIVASSGLSVHESSAVSRETARHIGFGVAKDKLEVSISCQGREQGGNYLYYSDTDLESGEPDEMMIISFDGYDTTRTVVYVDRAKAASDYAGSYMPLDTLTPYNSIEEVEEMVGDTASVFLRDKSGRTRICFGPVDITADLFSASLRASLVVVLDPASDVAYYNYYGPTICDNPLPAELSRRQLRQVSTVEEYGNDLAAAERALLLPGLTIPEAEAVLKVPAAGIGDELSDEGFELMEFTAGHHDARYRYRVSVMDGIIMDAEFENIALTSSDRFFLSGIEASEIADRESIELVQGSIEILPSHMLVDESSVILGYGHPILRGDEPEYPLIVKLWSGTGKVLGFRLLEG